MNESDPSLLPASIVAEDTHFILDRLLGFFELKALSIAVDHRLVTLLAEKPSNSAELAARAGLPERGVRFLLTALTGMELVACDAERRYAPTARGRKYFVEGSPFNQGAYVKLFDWVFDALPKLPDGIKENRPVWEGPSHYLKNDSSQGTIDLETTRAKEKLFNESVNASQILVAQTVFRHVDLSGYRRLLDVGGSYGRFVATALTRFPQLTGTTFDLPQVAPEAEKQIAGWGLSQRMNAVGGDFLKDWPTGYDVISFIRVLNARTTEVCQQMLKKAFDLLPSGGRVVFMDAPVLSGDPNHPGRLASRLTMMVVTHSRGEVRSLTEWHDLIVGAGFNEPDQSAFEDPYGIISATKP